MKIFDTFLFFQEIDLLKIRLEYLYDEVDFFIILEYSQKFNGDKKEFLFEKNKREFDKYQNKILYFKVDLFHENYLSIKNYLSKSKLLVHHKILEFIESHDHYSKNELNWVLDSFQKEYIHYYLSMYAKDDDLIIFSDLDELPNLSFLNSVKYDLELKNRHFVAKQNEFKYFINLLSSTEWFGSIAGLYSNISKLSLNDLRKNSRIDCKIFTNGGYHFTSCGGNEMLVSKIESWGHQEFNYSLLKKTAYKRVLSGYDAFGRRLVKVTKIIDINDEKYFDLKLLNIVLKFPHLIKDKLNHFSKLDFILLFCVYNFNFAYKICRKIKNILI